MAGRGVVRVVIRTTVRSTTTHNVSHYVEQCLNPHHYASQYVYNNVTLRIALRYTTSLSHQLYVLLRISYRSFNAYALLASQVKGRF